MTITNQYEKENVNLINVEDSDMNGKRQAVNRGRAASPVGSRLGKGADRARYWSALLISMIMIVGIFAIMPVQAAGPATVNLGTAGDFVVLAKTGISATGTAHITGDIGISPAAATYITGFGLIMDASNVFSTSSLITGKAYAADYTAPTPTKMTTAVSDMETAYTDAAGRTLPDYTELYAGDLTGKTLNPGLYKWGTGVLISAGGVTISGAPSDVWILQIAQDLTVANSAIVTLTGGAQASNIFWQVAGQTTIGTTVAMKGIILCQTQIAFNTGATLVGRALAQTAVTLDANSISVTPDTNGPTVSSTLPANAATNVAINSAMTATFSEAMDSSTITTTTFKLNQGTTPVSGEVTYAGITATFTPASNLVSSTAYTATITTGAKDLAGNAMASDHSWSFTTGIISDTAAPTVSSTVPANAATGIAVNSAMTATFSEAMRPVTITTSTFTLKHGTTAVSGAVTYAGVKATFIPATNLASSTEYTATITTAAKDLAGNALASNHVWTFTTAAPLDTTAPTVSTTVPANAATNIAINSVIRATFSEAMSPPTLTTTTFTLKHGVTAVSGAVTYTGTMATFTPAANLISSAVYTATITTGAKDLAGNALASNYVWSFTTGGASSSAGTISGRLVDNDGNPVANATVSLGNTGTSTTTDANGDYSFSDVEPGTYSVGFNATGYEPSAVTSTVDSGQTTTVPDTVISPDDSGVSNLLLIIGAIAVALAAVLIGWKLMANRKKNKHA